MSSSRADACRLQVNVRRTRQIFDRRAAAFDDVAFLPREVARRMHERFDYIKLAPAHVLDAGCGPGADVSALRARFSTATIIGVDISYPMLVRAASAAFSIAEPHGRRRWSSALSKVFGVRAPPAQRFVQADFATLPFAPNAFDVLWSNLALHWHASPDCVLPEWHRILKVGGLLMFSAPGPDSLRELRTAWRVADSAYIDTPAARVMSFIDMHDLGDMLVESGFEIPVMDMETLTLTYRSPVALLNDVRRWGAYPFECADRPMGLTGRCRHAALLAALDAQRNDSGLIVLTFEVIYGHAWKARATATPEGYGIVRPDEIGGRIAGVAGK